MMHATVPAHLRGPSRSTVVAFVVLVAMLFAWMVLTPGKGVLISVHAQYSRAGVAEWYYDDGGGFREDLSAVKRVRAGDNVLEVEVPLGRYRALRFDPINEKGVTVVIHSIGISPAARVQGAAGVAVRNVRAGPNIAQLSMGRGGLHVTTSPTNADPQLEVTLPEPLQVLPAARPWGRELVMSVLLALILVPLLRAAVARATTRQLTIAGMAIALVLMAVMDWITLNHLEIHPDEPLHLSCFQFFLDHAWPARIGDPSQLASLTSSPFGTTYLNQWDIVYFIAGHLMQAFAFLGLSPLFMARLFQHLVWLGLLAMAVRGRAWTWALGAAVVSAQTWYVFSYFNGDAFPVGVGLATAALLADADGDAQRYLRGETRFWRVGVLCTALGLGLLIVSKSNSMPVVLGLFLWLAVQHLGLRWRELLSVLAGVALVGIGVFAIKLRHQGLPVHNGVYTVSGGVLGLFALGSVGWRYLRDRTLRTRFHRVLALAVMALAFAAPRIADDVYLNGGPQAKSAALRQARETYAAPAFKPSALASGGGFQTSAIARKGTTLGQMLFAPLHWFRTTARSAFGVYGYMNILSASGFYVVIWGVMLALVTYLSAVLIRRDGSHGGKLVAVVLGTALLMLLSSILFSWVVALQAQGRYLLPLAAMLALLMGACGEAMERRPARLLLLAAMTLSVGSFAATGLPGVVALF